MDKSVYLAMQETQFSHWWYAGRHAVLKEILKKISLPPRARILEVGSGTGANLPLLSEFGDVMGFEMDQNACKFSRAMGWNVRQGAFPDELDVHGKPYDLICMFDVLEHISDDSKAIESAKGLLAKDGKMLIACPAYQWLFGDYDRFLGHYRRYTLGTLQDLLKANGFHVQSSGYFNTLLFPLVAAGRLCELVGFSARKKAISTPHPAINRILTLVFSLEAIVAQFFFFPFGTSVFVSATAAQSDTLFRESDH